MLNLVINDKEKLQNQLFFQSGTEKIDSYLVDPVNNSLETKFANRPDNFFEGIRFYQKRRKRIVLKKGIENVSVLLESIALFYSENKITYAIDNMGVKHMAQTNLIEIEKEVDNTLFFRANRQFIINIEYLKSFRNYEKVKIKIFMKPEELNSKYVIIISQDRSHIFRQWINAA